VLYLLCIGRKKKKRDLVKEEPLSIQEIDRFLWGRRRVIPMKKLMHYST